MTLGNLEPRCIIYSHTDSKRSFQTTIYLEWHRSSRKLRLPAEVDPRGKRRLYRGDKGRRGRYGKSSLEKKKELIGDQLKRSSKRVHDAAGWVGTMLRGKKKPECELEEKGLGCFGEGYFPVGRPRLLRCTSRRNLPLLFKETFFPWLQGHRFATWLPWTFIRQTFAVVCHPTPFFLYFQTTGIHYYAALLGPGEFTEDQHLALPMFVCFAFVVWYLDVFEGKQRLCLNKDIVGALFASLFLLVVSVIGIILKNW